MPTHGDVILEDIGTPIAPIFLGPTQTFVSPVCPEQAFAPCKDAISIILSLIPQRTV